jgi:hypothetical protein
MKKSILSTSTNNKTFNKKTNPDKKFKLNSKFFSLKFIPYNKILNDLLMYLQKKLSTSLFNEIMKHFINEIKKYLRKNISSNTVSNNISINKNQTEILNRSKNNRVISEFCFKNNNNDKVQSICKNRTKINLKKFILPYFNLSHSHKLKNNFLSTREISSFSNNLNYKNDGSDFSLLDDKDISLILTENNYTVDNIGKKKKIQKNKTNNNSLAKQNQSKNKYSNIFLSNNSNYKTINTTINKNLKNKIFQTDKTKILTKKLKLEFPSSLKTLTTKKFPFTKKKENKNFIKNKFEVKGNLKDLKSLNNAVVINNTFFNKYKNNYNFGLIPNTQKKLKLVNIKLKEKDTKGNVRIISPVQNPNEMLDKIKKSLDDDNLRVMLNFSYENFLSKESERTSKEYSFGD